MPTDALAAAWAKAQELGLDKTGQYPVALDISEVRQMLEAALGVSLPGAPAGPAPESVTLPRAELDQLLAVATMYVHAFEPDELMSLPGKLLLQDIEAILGKYGRRY